MDKAKSKKIRNALYFLMPIIVPLLFVNFSVDSDTYWIIKTGEYICNNGIPTKDFFDNAFKYGPCCSAMAVGYNFL